MPLNNASIIQIPYRAKKCRENASTIAKCQPWSAICFVMQWYYSEIASEILKFWIFLKTPEKISINIASKDKLIEDSDTGRIF